MSEVVVSGDEISEADQVNPSPVIVEVDPPPPQQVRGFRLDQIMLFGTMVLVLAVIGLAGAAQVYSIQREYRDEAAEQTARLQARARGIGRTLSRTLSITAAGALRDNDYGALAALVKDIAAENPLIVRLQILDTEGNVAAGTRNDVPEGLTPGQLSEARFTTATYEGQPVFDYVEPIQTASRVHAGALVLSYSLSDLQGELRRLDEQRRVTVRRTTVRTVGVGALAVLMGAVLAFFQSRRITRPLGHLTTVAGELAQGKLETRAEPPSGAGREVASLAFSFNDMADRIQLLLEEARGKALLEEQVQLAKAVQETLLPDSTPFDFGALHVAGRFVPADQCGGDLWFRAPIQPGRLLLAIGDVTGHGLSTALIASGVLGGFASALAARQAADIEPELLLRVVNRAVLSLARGSHQLSCAAAVFDLAKGEVQISNGGHPFPAVFNRMEGPVGSAPVRGPLLGRTEEFVAKPARYKLRPGDVYVWYTDGLLECRDPSGATFGWNRLLAAIEKYRNEEPALLRDALLDEVAAFRGEAAPLDDITLVVVEHRATESR